MHYRSGIMSTEHSRQTYLCFQSHKLILEGFVALLIGLRLLEVTSKVIGQAGVLLLDARQRVLDVTVEAMNLASALQLQRALLARLGQLTPDVSVNRQSLTMSSFVAVNFILFLFRHKNMRGGVRALTEGALAFVSKQK